MVEDDSCGRESLTPLLERALREPFAHDAVDDWLRQLMHCFPLWSFQAGAYVRLHQAKLPTTYPLQLMIRSICRDEGFKSTSAHKPPFFGPRLPPLEAEIDHRRYVLAECGSWDPPGSPRLRSVSQRSGRLAPGPGWFCGLRPGPPRPPEYDPDDPRFYGREFRKLGEELIELAEKYHMYPPQIETWRLLRRYGLVLPHGAHTKGVRRRFLQPLHKEGAALLELCWKMFPLSSVGSSAATILDAEGVTAASDQLRWAARLVLPVFSAPEIEALKSEAVQARTWGKRKDRPTPKRLAVWVLANRTGMKANKVASKIGFGERAKYFKLNSSPIKPHSS